MCHIAVPNFQNYIGDNRKMASSYIPPVSRAIGSQKFPEKDLNSFVLKGFLRLM